MRTITLFSAFILFALQGFSQDGQAIFKKNCAVCHSIGSGKLVGPDLKGMDKKHDIKWLNEWIKSSQAMIKKGDKKAVQIFNDNNKMVMPDQAISEAEIKSIVAFVSEETTKLEQPPAAVASVTTPQQNLPQQPALASTSSGISSKVIIYVLIGIIAFLTMVLYALSNTIRSISGKE
jgi:mono/diheme cytochrome c family protein